MAPHAPSAAHFHPRHSQTELHLSIHSRSHLANRFGLLATPDPSPRRYRHTRGSKESKRRRDARRSRRKREAARLWDDHTRLDTLHARRLRKIPPCHPPHLLDWVPTPVSAHLPTTPPPPPLLPQRPTWCPDLPPFTVDHPRWSDFSFFFDLSMLPEPAMPSRPPSRTFYGVTDADSVGKELQLWRPRQSPYPKVSRFFPPEPSSPPAVSVRLPSQDEPSGHPSSVEGVSLVRDRETPTDEPTAANLWRILTTKDASTQTHDNVHIDGPIRRWTPPRLEQEERLGTLSDLSDNRLNAIGMPCEIYELEAALFPVHARSPDEESHTWPHDCDLPPLPPSPALQSPESDARDPAQPDAHFRSEQALFALPSAAPAMDVASFLELGHSPDCWCGWCASPPELLDADADDDIRSDTSTAAHPRSSTTATTMSSTWDDEWSLCELVSPPRRRARPAAPSDSDCEWEWEWDWDWPGDEGEVSDGEEWPRGRAGLVCVGW